MQLRMLQTPLPMPPRTLPRMPQLLLRTLLMPPRTLLLLLWTQPRMPLRMLALPLLTLPSPLLMLLPTPLLLPRTLSKRSNINRVGARSSGLVWLISTRALRGFFHCQAPDMGCL